MERGKRKYNLLGKLIGSLVAGTIVFFIVRTLISSWNEIPFNQFRFEPTWLVISYTGLVASFSLTIKAWQQILGSMGQVMGYRAAWWVITGSYLAKYVPGHIWAVGGRMWLCKHQGVSEKFSGTGMLLEMMLLLLSSLMIFAAGLPLLSVRNIPGWSLWLLIPAPLMAAALFTPLLPWSLQTLSRFVLKREISLEIRRGGIIKALLLIIASSAIQGVAFFALVRSVFPVKISILPNLTAVYNGAWAAGFLSIIAPGGLGVREGALVLFLKSYLPLSVAIILAAVARFWITVFEIAMAFIGLYMRKAR